MVMVCPPKRNYFDDKTVRGDGATAQKGKLRASGNDATARELKKM